MAEQQRWIITTSGELPLKEVARRLKKAGLTVEQELTEIGCLIGTAAAADKLRAVTGVADVSPDAPVDIGPPDAPVTW
jgi:hypothetical protein